MLGFQSCGYYDGKYWFLRGRVLKTWVDDAPDMQPSSKTHPVARVVRSGAKDLFQLLCMGVNDADVGTISWENRQFSIPSTGIKDVIIQGTILFDQRELVSGLLLEYNDYRKRVDYHYPPQSDSSALPNRINYFLDKDGQLEPIKEFRIIAIETGNTLLSSDYFDETPFEDSIKVGSRNYALHAGHSRLIRYINTTPFFDRGDGILDPVKKSIGVTKPSTSPNRWPILALIAGLVIIPPAVFLWVQAAYREKGTIEKDKQ